MKYIQMDISSHSNPTADSHPSCDPDHPHHSSKGRKGDPRMHQAVAARIDNPNFTLFQALHAGGFEYPTDDDAACVDSENVTLGQRKNQLSRRIRLAKKQLLCGSGDHHADPSCNGSHSSSNHDEITIDPASNDAINKNNNSNKLGPMDINNMRPLAGMKRGISENTNTADSFALANAAAAEDDNDPLNTYRSANRIKAKNHPEFHPIIVPRISAPNDSYSLQQTRSQSFDSTPPLPPSLVPGTSVGGEAFGMRFQQLSQNGRQQEQEQQQQQQGQQQQQQQSSNRRHYEQEQQGQQQQHHGHRSSSSRSASASAPSGVAVASLSQTAAKVGLTLEQLALTLSSSSNLTQLLAQTSDSNSSGAAAEKLHELALRLYQNEARALYQKAMLLAGYRHDDCREGSSKHLQFALAAWQLEGKRLQSVREQMVMGEAPLEVKQTADAAGVSKDPDSARESTTTTAPRRAFIEGPVGALGHGHCPQEDEHDQDGGEEDGVDCYLDGRHIHRLEGKCGHKAILHQPIDGTAHIDFLVGNKVECYHGVKPMAPCNSVNISVWPSTYNCEDLSCPDKCNDKMMSDHSHSDGACASVTYPKILELQDIDLEGKEWNLDFSNSDQAQLLGLFKLGGADEEGGDDGFPTISV